MRASLETPSLPSPGCCLLLSVLLCIGCPKPTPTEPPAEAEVQDQPAAALGSLRLVAEREIPGVEALACGEVHCAWASAEGVTFFQPTTLEPLARGAVPNDEAEALILRLAPSPPDPPQTAPVTGDMLVTFPLPVTENPMDSILEQAEPDRAPEPSPEPPPNPAIAERAAWAALMEAGQRLPFQRRVPVAGGGMITYQRELGGGPGKLLRIGGGFRSVAAPGTIHDVSCEGWLAPHPSGLEVYLLLWPSPTMIAYDTRSMATRWSLDLPAPAQGLFVDPAGRYALLSLTEPPDPDRLTDYAPPTLSADPGADPLRGSEALPDDHPTPTGVVLVDLAAKRVAAQASGAFRAWVASPDGAWLLATQTSIQRLEAR